jgi:hypothetical protein
VRTKHLSTNFIFLVILHLPHYLIHSRLRKLITSVINGHSYSVTCHVTSCLLTYSIFNQNLCWFSLFSVVFSTCKTENSYAASVPLVWWVKKYCRSLRSRNCPPFSKIHKYGTVLVRNNKFVSTGGQCQMQIPLERAFCACQYTPNNTTLNSNVQNYVRHLQRSNLSDISNHYVNSHEVKYVEDSIT